MRHGLEPGSSVSPKDEVNAIFLSKERTISSLWTNLATQEDSMFPPFCQSKVTTFNPNISQIKNVGQL
jgi:hypothetical protein